MTSLRQRFLILDFLIKTENIQIQIIERGCAIFIVRLRNMNKKQMN